MNFDVLMETFVRFYYIYFSTLYTILIILLVWTITIRSPVVNWICALVCSFSRLSTLITHLTLWRVQLGSEMFINLWVNRVHSMGRCHGWSDIFTFQFFFVFWYFYLCTALFTTHSLVWLCRQANIYLAVHSFILFAYTHVCADCTIDVCICIWINDQTIKVMRCLGVWPWWSMSTWTQSKHWVLHLKCQCVSVTTSALMQ